MRAIYILMYKDSLLSRDTISWSIDPAAYRGDERVVKVTGSSALAFQHGGNHPTKLIALQHRRGLAGMVILLIGVHGTRRRDHFDTVLRSDDHDRCLQDILAIQNEMIIH